MRYEIHYTDGFKEIVEYPTMRDLLEYLLNEDEDLEDIDSIKAMPTYRLIVVD